MGLIGFLKKWTLPSAIVAGCAFYVFFAYMPVLREVSPAFVPWFDGALPVLLFLVLFVNFCKADFKKMRPVRWHLWVSVVQVVFVVVLAAVILLFRLQGRSFILSEAILTCIIGPCAAASPVVTAKLGGNLENMTTYTLLSNLLTAILIPVAFPIIDSGINMPFLQAFSLILYKVCLILLVPMLLAYIVKHHWQSLHRRIVSIKDLSFYLWASCLSVVTGITLRNILHADTSGVFIMLIAVVSLLLCLMQFYIGRRLGHHFGSVVECGQALGQKNTSFAIWIACAYLNPLSSVGPGCYILWQNLANSYQLIVWDKTHKQGVHSKGSKVK